MKTCSLFLLLSLLSSCGEKTTPKEQSKTSELPSQQLNCPMLFNPVCGKDGKTYSNSCVAGIKKVEVDYVGECR